MTAAATIAPVENRFAIKELHCIDPNVNGPLYWNFTAWRRETPDVLLTADAAAVELARLQKVLRKTDELVVIDVVAAREKARIYSKAVRGVFTAAGYDGWEASVREQRGPALHHLAAKVGQMAVEVAGY